MISALYARVSTQRQENEETIETQIMAIREYAEKNRHTLVKDYKDEGWSGTILARPSLDDLRLDARKKLWEAVIIYDPDRVARKYAYQALVIEELEELGIKVLFVTTPPAKTDEDRLLYGVKGLFAEYERTRIADRFRLGKLRKAREGNVVTTEAPYGYDYIPKQGQKHGYFLVNKRESLVVKMVYEWIANEGYTIRGVVRKLQELGIPPRKSKRGVWNTSTLGTMLRNETYIGNAQYNRSYAVVPEKPLKIQKYKKIKKTSRRWKPKSEWIDIPTVPKIITKELFDKTRMQLKLNFDRSNRNKKNEYLLSGIIYCVCG
jgi:site-specific DNA recombinase